MRNTELMAKIDAAIAEKKPAKASVLPGLDGGEKLSREALQL